MICSALIVVTACAVSYGVAQTPASGSAITFAPLVQWKNAVLSGDRAGLTSLYSTAPAAKVTVPPAESTPDADIDFWTGLKARSIDVDILQNGSPQPGVQVVRFQAEIQSGTPPENETLYVNEGQVWQQQGGEWRLVVVQRTNAAHLRQPVSQNKNIYPADANALVEIKQAEEKAGQEHKRVLLVFGANWCYDCHVLDLAFQRPDFAAAMAGYEVVHVDIGPDGKKNSDLAKQFQVPLDKGVPALAVADSAGKVLVSQKNGEFENARAMTPQALLEFLNKWKPEAPVGGSPVGNRL
ncbi:MAG: thioredoxin family protein [Candidatus Sulfotelmatobacter sp.]